MTTELLLGQRAVKYSVILLDELDKAHPGVQDVFLQVFGALHRNRLWRTQYRENPVARGSDGPLPLSVHGVLPKIAFTCMKRARVAAGVKCITLALVSVQYHAMAAPMVRKP